MDRIEADHTPVEDPLGYWTVFCDEHNQWEQMTAEEIEAWLNKPRPVSVTLNFPY